MMLKNVGFFTFGGIKVIYDMSDPTTLITTVDNTFVAYLHNKLYLSTDHGRTCTKSMDITGVGTIKFIHVFQDGSILFCSHDKAYYTTDFITFAESTVLDIDGSPATLTQFDNFSAYNYCNHQQIVNGHEVLVWGNYSTLSTIAYSHIKVWYTVDMGATIKMCYKFRSDKMNTSTGFEYARHVHNVVFNPADSSFWILTGDHSSDGIDEQHVIKGFYNDVEDSWAWQTVGSGYNFKIAQMLFYGDYAYWTWDVTNGGVIKCLYTDIADITKHVQITQTLNDTLDIAMSASGEMIVIQSLAGGSDDPKKFLYSPDRINFYPITGTFPPSHSYSPACYYALRGPTSQGKVSVGVYNYTLTTMENWPLNPRLFLDDFIREQGFPNAFQP